MRWNKRHALIGGLLVVVVAGAGLVAAGVFGAAPWQRPASGSNAFQERAPSRDGASPGRGAPALSTALEAEGRTLMRLSQQAGVRAVPVRRMDIQRHVEATGTLAAAREQSLSFGIAGRVATVPVEEGATVKAGTVLATLRDDDQQLAYTKARNEYETARLEQGPAQVEEKRLALEKARRDLEATRLVAPFDGVVARLGVRPGDQVNAAQEVAWLVDMGSLEAHVAVDEVDLAYVKPGQAVTVTVKTYPDLAIPGHVDRIAAAGRAQGDVVLFDVVVKLDRGDPRLRPGMSATALVEVQNARNVLAVPEEAVAEVNGETLVSRVVGDSLQPVRVELGVSDGSFVEVRSGLQEGDLVLATNYAVYRRLTGGQEAGAAGRQSSNPFFFRLSPGQTQGQRIRTEAPSRGDNRSR
ncbi:efflux RND transporter periplasmic adaptor subunit [Carboxydochorda subterranea]|uniref:Efflux RND transporter periplasmic adaptor subunit n=1 Tax=Carboxydichorda subterranea TaxID=3109565 RepID=A0ABZ1BXT1_9FIRM|nr:efflux RND transporter periplasmic adaptor subunit [Limnochorda sp. L945t]WRP17504.1 efflux RND transporter periplasmic adaptor subunit [Limnochorda sp. L945t]